MGGPPGGSGTHTEGAGPEQEQEVAPPPAGGGAVTPPPTCILRLDQVLVLRFCSEKLPGAPCCCPLSSLTQLQPGCLPQRHFPNVEAEMSLQAGPLGRLTCPAARPTAPLPATKGSEGHSSLYMAVWDNSAPQGPRDCCWLLHCHGSGSRNVPGLTDSWPRNRNLC